MSCFSTPLSPEDILPPPFFEDFVIGSDKCHVLFKVHSAPDKMRRKEVWAPGKTSQAEIRPVLHELVLSSPRLNTDPAAAVAANRLLEFTRGTSPARRHGLTFPKTPESVLSDHKRRLSRVARNTFGHRTTASQDSFSVHSDSDSTITDIQTDLGGPSRPIMNFRPNLWRRLDRDRSMLNLDLFWPLKTDLAQEDDDDDDDQNERVDVLPFDDMRPLCEFRHLRYLQLNGMLRSYQKHIWLTCWLNPALEELNLEMALEPTMHHPYGQHCPAIEWDWEMKRDEDGSVEYLGQNGDGILSPEFGIGEYLDRQAIATAKLDAAPRGGRLRYLPVVKLGLSGFVIDSGTLKWFDPMRLRQIDIKHSCIDAGFALPANMIDVVQINLPSKRECKVATMTRIVPQDIRMVTLRGGRVVNENTWTKPRVESRLSHRWFPATRKLMTKEGGDESWVGRKLSSSRSISSLGQKFHPGRSGKSHDFIVL